MDVFGGQTFEKTRRQYSDHIYAAGGEEDFLQHNLSLSGGGCGRATFVFDQITRVGTKTVSRTVHV